MAAKISFKQQCPSCEAMVPIRDPKLVGRKIDCPKCKYRFVVEEPVEDEDEDEEEADVPAKKKGGAAAITNKKPANGKAGPQRRGDDEDDEDEGKPAKKPSGGGSGIMIVGIGLAAVAVLALAIGAWLLFGGDKDPKTKSLGGPVANNAPQGNGGEVKQENPQGDQGPKEPKPRVEDVTNLLPNDAQVVLNLPLRQLLSNGAVKRAALLTHGAFRDADFQRTWGIPSTEVRRVVLGVNAEKKTVFSVMRTGRPLKEDQVVAGLKLKAETPIGGMNYYLLKKPLDGLSTFLLKMNAARDQVALHFFDSFTVVCADPAAVQQFLQENGKPKHLSQSPSSEAEPTGDAAPKTPGAPAGAPGAKPGTPGAPGAKPGAPAAAGAAGNPPGPPGAKTGAPPNAPGAKPGAPGAPGSKAGTPPNAPGGQPGTPPGPPGAKPGAPGGQPGKPGGQPGKPGGQPSGVGGFKPPSMPGAPGMVPGTRPGGSDSGPAPVSSSYLTVDPHLKAVLDQVEKTDTKEGQVVLLSVAVNASVMDAEHFKELAEFVKKLIQQSDVPQLPDFVRKQIEAAGFGLTELSDAKISANAAVEVRGEKLVQEWEKEVTTALLPGLIARTGLDILSKDEIAKLNSQSNSPGNFQGRPMPPGNSSTIFPGRPPGEIPQGAGFPQPGRGGKGPGGQKGKRPPGGYPPGAQPPGGFPPGAQPPDDEDEEDAKKGKDGDYVIWTADNVLALGANVNGKAVPVSVSLLLGKAFKILRGGADLADNHSRIHELAAATQAFLQKEGHFPRGTVPRALDSSSERFLDWRPDQRLSWMVQLLPYFSNGAFSNLRTENDKSWNESENLLTAMTVIPQFLAPLPPDKPFSYFVQYPGLKGAPLAATHFVGVAGVGLDAAEYRADDAAKSKLRGIFGYDRETKPAEIKDGLAQTILLIQVPPTPHAPWIAGGGSTVRGVSTDSDCVQPFVCAEHEGKRGTFAIMADGKVRFIPATIDPKTFQALCTIAGGEKIKDLDAVAPEVPPPDEEPQQPELKAEPLAPPAPPSDAKPAEGAGKSELPAGWKEIVSKEGRYRVAMPPGQMQEIPPKKMKSSLGEGTLYQKMVVLPDKVGTTYLVQYVDVSGDTKDAEAAFDGFRNDTLSTNPGSQVRTEKKITLAGRPGRELQVVVPQKGDLSVHIYLDKNRLYSLIARGAPGKGPAKDIQAFFDSFQITAP
ncbi:MAG TPA: DUF1559 domain-containing protein [Gemmataceae bacterium]